MFSVVIPLYNKENLVLRTIYSVLTQTFQKFEVIVVNDGSTDASLNIVEKNITDPRLHIINQINQGVSEARNNGVKAAKYDYIAFLDADDEWLPGYLQKVSEAIKLYPNAGMFCTPGLHRSILTGHGNFHLEKKYKNKIIEVDYFESPKKIGGQTSGVVISKSHFMILVEKYEGKGFPKGLNLNEDWACFQSLAFICKTVYIGYSLYIRNTEVKGQLVSLADDGFDMRLNKTPKYLNITFKNYIISNSKSKNFLIFRKHEIRSLISFFLRGGYNISVLKKFLNNLDSHMLKILPKFEIELYNSSKSRILILIYLTFTKIFWSLQKNIR